jgi:CubicO group peptidase (beta-lactamase class C family)
MQSKARSIRFCVRKRGQGDSRRGRDGATGKEVIYQGAFGKRDLSQGRSMTADSVFWIASMTKAITTAAGMQLVEQGKLSLDEPIGKLLPDLASRRCWKALTPTASRNCGLPRSRSRCASS